MVLQGLCRDLRVHVLLNYVPSASSCQPPSGSGRKLWKECKGAGGGEGTKAQFLALTLEADHSLPYDPFSPLPILVQGQSLSNTSPEYVRECKVNTQGQVLSFYFNIASTSIHLSLFKFGSLWSHILNESGMFLLIFRRTKPDFGYRWLIISWENSRCLATLEKKVYVRTGSSRADPVFMKFSIIIMWFFYHWGLEAMQVTCLCLKSGLASPLTAAG